MDKGGQVITNSVPTQAVNEISGPGFHSWTDDTGNNAYVDTWTMLPEVETTGTLEVDCVDLGVEKIAPESVDPGGQITWTIRVTNHGPGNSTGSTLTDALPSAATDPVTTTPGCS